MRGVSGPSRLVSTCWPPPGPRPSAHSSVRVAFTEVHDGMGQPGSYDVRFAAGTTLVWGGSARGVSRGTCSTPLSASRIGARFIFFFNDRAPPEIYTFPLHASLPT